VSCGACTHLPRTLLPPPPPPAALTRACTHASSRARRTLSSGWRARPAPLWAPRARCAHCVALTRSTDRLRRHPHAADARARHHHRCAQDAGVHALGQACHVDLARASPRRPGEQARPRTHAHKCGMRGARVLW
jgi:hypothetical protein